MKNKIRTGYTKFNTGMFFIVPPEWDKFDRIDNNGKKIARVSSSCWLTNFKVTKQQKKFIPYKKYKSDEYPKYENLDAINIDKYKEIPYDYAGAMGVPITFLDKLDPAQFKIIGLGLGEFGKAIGVAPHKPRHKRWLEENGKPVLKGYVYLVENGNVKVPYVRLIIKNRKVKN